MNRLWLPLATSVLFAGSFVAGKYTTADLGPLSTTLARYVVASAALAALIPWQARGSLSIAPRDLPAVLALGLAGVVGYHALFFAALARTEIINTAVVNALGPAVTALAAAAMLGERLGRRAHVGVALVCAGVVVVVSGGSPARLLALDLRSGDALMLGAVLCWTAYALLLRVLLSRYEGFTLTFHAALGGTAMLGLAAPLWGSPVAELSAISTTSAISVLYMGAGATALGYLLYARSVAALGPTRTASVIYGTVPVAVALLAWAFFGDVPRVAALAGVALVVAGLRLTVGGVGAPDSSRHPPLR